MWRLNVLYLFFSEIGLVRDCIRESFQDFLLERRLIGSHANAFHPYARYRMLRLDSSPHCWNPHRMFECLFIFGTASINMEIVKCTTRSKTSTSILKISSLYCDTINFIDVKKKFYNATYSDELSFNDHWEFQDVNVNIERVWSQTRFDSNVWFPRIAVSL